MCLHRQRRQSWTQNAEGTDLSEDALRVVHDLLQPVHHLVAVDLTDDVVVLALLPGNTQQVLPARVG